MWCAVLAMMGYCVLFDKPGAYDVRVSTDLVSDSWLVVCRVGSLLTTNSHETPHSSLPAKVRFQSAHQAAVHFGHRAAGPRAARDHGAQNRQAAPHAGGRRPLRKPILAGGGTRYGRWLRPQYCSKPAGAPQPARWREGAM